MTNAINGTAISWIMKNIKPTKASLCGESISTSKKLLEDFAAKKIMNGGMHAKGTTCKLNSLGIEGFVSRSSCQPAVGDQNNLNSVVKCICFLPFGFRSNQLTLSQPNFFCELSASI
jgi:hypothetical protein